LGKKEDMIYKLACGALNNTNDAGNGKDDDLLDELPNE